MTAFAYVNDYRVMAEMTAAVGAHASSQRYLALYVARRSEFHNAFYSPGNASFPPHYGRGTQSVCNYPDTLVSAT